MKILNPQDVVWDLKDRIEKVKKQIELRKKELEELDSLGPAVEELREQIKSQHRLATFLVVEHFRIKEEGLFPKEQTKALEVLLKPFVVAAEAKKEAEDPKDSA